MRRLRATLAPALGLLALAAPATAAPRAVVTSFGSAGPVEIAMDGSRVAAVDRLAPCALRVRLGNVVTGAVRLVGRDTTCNDLNAEGGGPALALAGSDVVVATAWESTHHHPLLLGPAPRHRLRVVVEGEDADHDLGTFVGSVVGSGARRVYATWGYSWEPEGCDPVDETMACTLGAPVGEVRAFPSQRVLARLSGALLPVQMEGDRIALAAPDGAARVLGLDGVVRADVPAARARSVAVVGDRLVTLRRGSPTLDVWDAATGAAITSIPLARGATGRLDAARVHGDAWVAYRTGASVRAVRLADARSVIVARTPAGRQVTDVQLESPGIAWTTARGPARAPRATVLRFARLPDPPPAPSA